MVGGETVTFAGEGFSTNIADITVVIDGVNCDVTSASLTEIQCTTGPRPGLVDSSLDIFIAGKGSVSLQGLLFTYANYWS